MNFEEDLRFAKELKKLCKKYKQLAEDLKLFRLVHGSLRTSEASDDFKRNFFAGNNAISLHRSRDGRVNIVKARLDSRDLNNKALRVIYCCTVQEKKIILIEIYAKNQRSNEDKKRWREYMGRN